MADQQNHHMKTLRTYWPIFIALSLIAYIARSQSVPPPGITVSKAGTNQLSITVTNGVPYANYMFYNQHVLGGSNWTFITNPVPGVTNVTISQGPYFEGYYIASGSTNWNNNGIPNWDYADPLNPGLGVLSVTIVSPAQGAVIH